MKLFDTFPDYKVRSGRQRKSAMWDRGLTWGLSRRLLCNNNKMCKTKKKELPTFAGGSECWDDFFLNSDDVANWNGWKDQERESWQPPDPCVWGSWMIPEWLGLAVWWAIGKDGWRVWFTQTYETSSCSKEQHRILCRCGQMHQGIG